MGISALWAREFAHSSSHRGIRKGKCMPITKQEVSQVRNQRGRGRPRTQSQRDGGGGTGSALRMPGKIWEVIQKHSVGASARACCTAWLLVGELKVCRVGPDTRGQAHSPRVSLPFLQGLSRPHIGRTLNKPPHHIPCPQWL